MFANVPKWVTTDKYAINAEAVGDPTKDQMRLMMQSLLADRFKLAVHFERQETAALALFWTTRERQERSYMRILKVLPWTQIFPVTCFPVSAIKLLPQLSPATRS